MAHATMTTSRLERGPEQSVQAAVVLALRRQIEALPTGAYLGSEAEILARLGVSSPTLRQAARLLEQQQMLSVARGKGGGYFGRRPDGGATTRAAALYLDSVGTSMAQVRAASLPLMIEASRLAAQSTDADRRASFATALSDLKSLPPDADARVVLTLDRILVGELLNLAGNPAITLLLQVIYRLGRSAERRQRAFEAHADWSAHWLQHAARFGDAILERDPDLAVLLARRGSETTAGWLGKIEGALPETRGNENRFWRAIDGQASALQTTADALRKEILANPQGAFLGREETLADRYRVSRHTLRQAAVV